MHNKIIRFLKVFAGVFVIGTCVNCINVQAAPVEINKTNFPDDEFRRKVACWDDNMDKTLTDSEISDIKSMEISYLDEDDYDYEYYVEVSSLKGIEYLYNLKKLDCIYSGSEKLDFSANKKLESINLQGVGNIKNISIDVSGNSKLVTLVAENCGIEKIDLSNNINLNRLSLMGNNISKIDVSKQNFKYLNLAGNPIGSIDIKNSTDLEELNVSNCKLTSLDLRNNGKLKNLYCGEYENVIRIHKDEGLFYHGYNSWGYNKFTYREKGHNKIAKLDLSNNKNLEKLYCDGNGLSDINVSAFGCLEHFVCDNNNIKKIDVSKNKKLEVLSASNNKLKSVRLRRGVNKLSYLNVNNNKLKTIDLYGFKGKSLYLSNNKFKTLNIKRTKKHLKYLDVSKNNIKKLDLKGFELCQVNVSNTKLKKLDLSSCYKLYSVNIKNTKIKYLEKGSFYVDEKSGYRYIVKKNNTLELVGGVNYYKEKYPEVINVPDTVKVGRKKIKVTSIVKNAFDDYYFEGDDISYYFSEVKKIVIGKNVKYVGKRAFYGCRKITNITIFSSSIKNIAKSFPYELDYDQNVTIRVKKNRLNYYKQVFKKYLDLEYFSIKKIK